MSMEKNFRKILFYCFILCLICNGLCCLAIRLRQDKIAVVDAVRLFDGYAMKIDLEVIAKKQLQSESGQLDSIYNALEKAKAVHQSGDETKNLAYKYNYLKSKLESDYSQSNRDINEKVWKRLNPLLTEYGKKKSLHLIIGANGMGSVLYNDAFYDQTDEVIKFVNRIYGEGN